MNLFTTADGVQLAYKRLGQGMPLALISGFTADHQVWQPLLPWLQDYFEVLVFDNRGVGQSARPDRPATTELMAEDALALISHCFGDRPCHVVGHSMGGAIAQTLVRLAPQQVASCTLLQTFARLAQPFRTVCEMHLRLLEEGADLDAFHEYLMPWVWGPQFLADQRKLDALAEAVRTNPHPQGLIGLRSQWHALRTFDSKQWLPELSVPMLIVAGERDLIAPVADAQELARLMPHATLHTIRCITPKPSVLALTTRSSTSIPSSHGFSMNLAIVMP